MPSCSFIGNQLLETLDAVASEGRDLNLADAADEKLPTFGEKLGDMIVGEDGRNRCHGQMALSTKACIGRQFRGRKSPPK